MSEVFLALYPLSEVGTILNRYFQKQPPRGVKRTKNMKIFCNKFVGEHPCRGVILINLQSNFSEIALLHGCSPVNLLYIYGTPFSRNTTGWLLLTLFVSFFHLVSWYYLINLPAVYSQRFEPIGFSCY